MDFLHFMFSNYYILILLFFYSLNSDAHHNTKTKATPKKKSAVYKFPYQQSDEEYPTKKKHSKSSYVDETLFGSCCLEEATFPAPWERNSYKQEQVAGRYFSSALPHTMTHSAVSKIIIIHTTFLLIEILLF